MNIKQWLGQLMGRKSVMGQSAVFWSESLGQAQWSVRNYRAFAQEGYSENPVVRRCVASIAKAALECPWFLTSKDAPLERDDHPALLLLRRPNPLQSWKEFLEAVMITRGISGEAPIRFIRVGRQVREMWVLRPDWLEITSWQNGLPASYLYTESEALNGEPLVSFPIVPEDLYLWKEYNPLNRWRGLSPLYSAAKAVDVNNQYSEANKALLDNGVRPSGQFVYAPKDGPQTLGDEQYKRLQDQIGETYTGAKNTGRPMLLEGGLQWVQSGLTPREMEFINGKKLTALEICQAYGVPAQIVGLDGSQTFANYEQARMSLYEDTVIPMLNSFLSGLASRLGPSFGDITLGAAVDMDDVPALEAKRAESRKTLEASTVLTFNEKREALGYEETVGGDVILVAAGLQPLEFAGEAPEPVPPELAGQDAYGPEEAKPVPGKKPPAEPLEDDELPEAGIER